MKCDVVFLALFDFDGVIAPGHSSITTDLFLLGSYVTLHATTVAKCRAGDLRIVLVFGMTR